MNFVWSILIFLSVLFLLIKGDSNILTIATDSIKNSLNICLELGIIYIFWCGILQIVEDCKIGIWLSNKLKPILEKIFPHLSNTAYAQISINLSTNMLGIGNASLPAGLKALEEINKNNNNKKSINTNLLITLNCISLQVVPTTVLSLYLNAGGQGFLIIWFCGLIISLICLISAIFLNSNLMHKKKDNNKH